MASHHHTCLSGQGPSRETALARRKGLDAPPAPQLTGFGSSRQHATGVRPERMEPELPAGEAKSVSWRAMEAVRARSLDSLANNASPLTSEAGKTDPQTTKSRPELSCGGTKLTSNARQSGTEKSCRGSTQGIQSADNGSSGCSCDPHAARAHDANPLKIKRHQLRKQAGDIVGGRIAACGRKVIGSLVGIHQMPSGGHHFGGLETCSSVWGCPVCAAKITEGRKAEIEHILKEHFACGGEAHMATLTIPHYRFQSARDLKRAVANTWRKIKTGKGWQTARDGCMWEGDVRALEVTHGDNGWHPHLHVLIFFKFGVTAAKTTAFASWLFDSWAKAIRRLGFGTCSADAFAFEPVDRTNGAARYVGKWGAALELTKAHLKMGKGGGRTPWQILVDISTGKTADIRLFREFYDAFHGARQLTWSRDIRAKYANISMDNDEDVASATPEETQIGAIAFEVWREIVRRNLCAKLLVDLDQFPLTVVADRLRTMGIEVVICSTYRSQSLVPIPCFTLAKTQS